ncbi:YggT family protein [Anaerosporobacter faecicola]|uniref:YggT family protein n=1 Tax=Anaerosporobacter faecicola TaxID=2718714 RepID=UPI001438A417|nr:YggT family protein [Anaerosporobacter faecicola]
MSNLIVNSLYVFFIVLEIILFIYFFTSWFPVHTKFKEFLIVLLEPILAPIRFLLKHSIFNTKMIDLAPMIALVVILFFQNIFYYLKL